jgi:hypothetical protein
MSDDLTEDQLKALRNLGRKRAGEDVDWIRIADACALTDKGLAIRTREGWEITPAGSMALSAVDPQAAADPDAPVQLF